MLSKNLFFLPVIAALVSLSAFADKPETWVCLKTRETKISSTLKLSEKLMVKYVAPTTARAPMIALYYKNFDTRFASNLPVMLVNQITPSAGEVLVEKITAGDENEYSAFNLKISGIMAGKKDAKGTLTVIGRQNLSDLLGEVPMLLDTATIEMDCRLN